MNVGDLVRLQGYGDEEIVRRVVRIVGDTVYVTRDAEIADAAREMREPRLVGFNKRYVLGVVREGEKQ